MVLAAVYKEKRSENELTDVTLYTFPLSGHVWDTMDLDIWTSLAVFLNLLLYT